jgi:hypothetical protein
MTAPLIITTVENLEALKVDYTHVLVKGSLVTTGGADLVRKINEQGFEKYVEEAAKRMSEAGNGKISDSKRQKRSVSIRQSITARMTSMPILKARIALCMISGGKK